MDYRDFGGELPDDRGESDGTPRLERLANDLYEFKEIVKGKFSKRHAVRSVIATTLDTASTVTAATLYGIEGESTPLIRDVMQRYGPQSLFLWDIAFTYPIYYGISLACGSVMSMVPEGRVRNAFDRVRRAIGAKSHADTSLAVISLLKYYTGASNVSKIISTFVPEQYSGAVDIGVRALLLAPYVSTLIRRGE